MVPVPVEFHSRSPSRKTGSVRSSQEIPVLLLLPIPNEFGPLDAFLRNDWRPFSACILGVTSPAGCSSRRYVAVPRPNFRCVENGISSSSIGDSGFSFDILPIFTSFLLLNPLQQLRRRLILRVLLHQLPPHGQIQNEPPQARHGVGCFADLVKVFEEPIRVHRHRFPCSGFCQIERVCQLSGKPICGTSFWIERLR